jgi:hypothetical protein
MPGPAAGWQWPRRFIAGTACAIPLSVDADGNTVTLTPQGAPAGLQFVRTAGTNQFTLQWTPTAGQAGPYSVGVMLGDGSQDTTYAWSFTVLADSSKRVRFQTLSQDLPAYVRVGDSLVTPLTIAANTGAPPYRYAVRLANPATVLLDTVVAGAGPARLVWRPTAGQLGYRQLIAVVSDGLGDGDTLYHSLKVVPMNTLPVKLSVSLQAGADTTLYGAVDMRFAARPETLTYTITDGDDPISEDYTVWVSSRTLLYTQVHDSAQPFNVLLDNHLAIDRDTVWVKVSDGTSRDSAVVQVLYGLSIGNFGGAALQMQGDGSAQYVVHHPFAGREYVNRWAALGAIYPFTTNMQAGVEPAYDTTAFGGHLVTLDFTRGGGGGSNLIVISANNAWRFQDSAFTLFFVAELDTLVAFNRYTLLSNSNGGNRFMAFGVANGTATAFTDVTVAPTGLAVQTHRWYVFTYRSALGRNAGNLAVQTWLSGAPSVPATTTLPNVVNMADAMIGATQSQAATNGWVGSIAEFLMYRGALSDANRHSVELYLSEKYGIPVQ